MNLKTARKFKNIFLLVGKFLIGCTLSLFFYHSCDHWSFKIMHRDIMTSTLMTDFQPYAICILKRWFNMKWVVQLTTGLCIRNSDEFPISVGRFDMYNKRVLLGRLHEWCLGIEPLLWSYRVNKFLVFLTITYYFCLLNLGLEFIEKGPYWF